MKNSVGIIGAGWLGAKLAQTLISRHFSVQATTQSSERIERLTLDNIPVEQLVLPIDGQEVSQLHAFTQQVLVVCIPPQLKKGRTDYPLKIQQIVKSAEAGNVKHLILLSTTAIYNGLSGSVSESNSLELTADKVAVLLEAEQNAQAFNGRTSILRLAGLIGPNRHPGGFFKKGRRLKDPHVSINLIHQKDVIELIIALIKNEQCEGVFNAASRTHISKGQFYRLASESLTDYKIDPNVINLECKLEGKIIQSDKIRETLHYQFYFDDLIDWLNNYSLEDVK